MVVIFTPFRGEGLGLDDATDSVPSPLLLPESSKLFSLLRGTDDSAEADWFSFSVKDLGEEKKAAEEWLSCRCEAEATGDVLSLRSDVD